MLVLRPLPAFSDNYIWTLADAAGRAVIVDPGDAAPVIEAANAGLKPVAILLTHHHDDHIGGAAALIERFDIPCYGPVDARIACPMQPVREGDRVRIDVLDLDLDVMEVPGHTTSHIAFHGGGFLFCGDTLFSLGCGRMFEGTPTQFLGSLDRLAALPGDTQVCCGHEYTQSNGRFSVAAEPDNAERDRRLAQVADLRSRSLPTVPSTMSSERACNPFLRVDQPGLWAGLEARGVAQGDRIAAFAALRAWKDGF
ncbi:MAG: hydroxyacylglutathione hydrolase [Gammaproteobacteria bacterium]|nr:hydroxyacylglutathione hydrolase [Gammaproteobacteria bacterium]